MIKPIGDKIIVKPEMKVEKTQSGLYIPTGAKTTATLLGTVVSVGEGDYNNNGDFIPMKVVPGQKVYYRTDAPIEIDDGVFMIRQSDVYAVEE